VLEARITSEFLHMGEEPDLIPSYTVFFAGCTFDCVYCQNWDISTHPRAGVAISPLEMARMIERMAGTAGAREPSQDRYTLTRNVNWVGGDPSPNILYILQTLRECRANIPQIWNSNMYLTEESMALLEGVVDLYLTDFKYGNDACALRLSNAPDYMRVVTRNHLLGRSHAEMIVRHLVLPGHVECCTKPALTWIASNLKDVKVNVMAQYRPEHLARDYPDISRRLRAPEYDHAVGIAEDLGLELVD
jgi:putative pyruvate formate lyase activating enzyme